MLSAAKHLAMRTEMLRCAQHDKLLPILIVKVHHRVRVASLDYHEDAMNRVPTTLSSFNAPVRGGGKPLPKGLGPLR